jgi:nucleoside-diphosphate-sugar epimerase
MITILGAGGTIGRALADALEDGYHNVLRVNRDTLPHILTSNRPVGHVIDCIGLTGDFRTRPLDTAHAHVGVTAACLAASRFESFLFLSSTRVYARAASTLEDAPLPCRPADPSDLYNLTKLTGEALCLADPRPTVRVVRLSNVYGPDMPNTFLTQVLHEGRATGAVRFRQAPESRKDYVSLDDVVALLPRIACRGRHRLYNLASGRNTSHRAIADVLRRAQGWDVGFEPAAPAVIFPPIEIARLREEFPRALRSLSEDLPTLSRSGQEVQCSPLMRQAVW